MIARLLLLLRDIFTNAPVSRVGAWQVIWGEKFDDDKNGKRIAS